MENMTVEIETTARLLHITVSPVGDHSDASADAACDEIAGAGVDLDTLTDAWFEGDTYRAIAERY
jgi:hypothetical protein